MKDFTQGAPKSLTLTVKRPSGEIEKIVHPTLKFITETQFKQIQKSTKDAGRGDVIGYEIDREIVDNRALKALKSNARSYDNLHNEGAEGFNPYR